MLPDGSCGGGSSWVVSFSTSSASSIVKDVSAASWAAEDGIIVDCIGTVDKGVDGCDGVVVIVVVVGNAVAAARCGGPQPRHSRMHT
jgi:hypothetical protein